MTGNFQEYTQEELTANYRKLYAKFGRCFKCNGIMRHKYVAISKIHAECKCGTTVDISPAWVLN